MQNTVPLDDCTNVVQAIAWLNVLSPTGLAVVAPPAFIGRPQLYMERMSSYGLEDPSQVSQGGFSGYVRIFLFYWAPQQGWYSPRLMPANATEIHPDGAVAVYEDCSSNDELLNARRYDLLMILANAMRRLSRTFVSHVSTCDFALKLVHSCA